MKNSRNIFVAVLIVISILLSGCGAALPAGAEANAQSDGSTQVEFAGTIEAINGNQITVDGKTFEVTDASLLAGFAVGDSVQFSATVGADGLVKLEGVEAFQASSSESNSSESEGSSSSSQSGPGFVGAVEAISGNQWTIGGQTFIVTNASEFSKSLVVGDLVKVELIPNPDGTFTIREMKVAPVGATLGWDNSSSSSASSGQSAGGASSSNSSQSGPEFVGAVEAISGNQWTIGGQTFIVTNASEFSASLVVGDLVKVELIPNPDGTFTIREMKVAPAGATLGWDNSSSSSSSSSQSAGGASSSSGFSSSASSAKSDDNHQSNDNSGSNNSSGEDNQKSGDSKPDDNSGSGGSSGGEDHGDSSSSGGEDH